MDWIEWAKYGAIAAAIIVIAWLAVGVIRAKSKPPRPLIEPPEPVQKYDKFPEPRGPTKTIEVREAKDGIPFP